MESQDGNALVAGQLAAAFALRDLDAFGRLLARDARWGDDDNPNQCRSRQDVVATFARLLTQGVTGRITDSVVGTRGVAIELHIEWPNPGNGRGADLYQSYLVTDGLVSEIQRHDDRRSAVAAVR